MHTQVFNPVGRQFGRSFNVRIWSAYRLSSRRLEYSTTTFPTLTRSAPTSTKLFQLGSPSPKTQVSESLDILRRGVHSPNRRFSSMHRAPAAMVTKPMADPNITINTPRDPNTLSNYHNYVTRHTSVDFDIDFERKRLYGSVTLTFESLTDDKVKDIVLDSRYVSQNHDRLCRLKLQAYQSRIVYQSCI